MNEIKKYREALKLAGKLAIASKFVMNSDVYSISDKVVELEKALDDYNNYIFNWDKK